MQPLLIPMRQIDFVKLYSQKRCLIVDDMPDIRVALTGMLRTFGVQQIDTVANGDQAIEICRSNQYDMVLCDYNLGPGMDGQQVLEELRHRNRLNNTSIFVMITAESSREMVLGALEYQPDDYVTKPITTALLRARLDRVVRRNRELFLIKQAMDEKDYTKAILCCEERLQDNTSYRNSCLQIQAEMNLRVFNFKNAENIYQGILEERPVIWAKLGLGKTQLAKKEYEKAQKSLEEVIRTDHRYVEAHDLLSQTFIEQGDNLRAQEVMQEAADLSPKSVFRQRRLAELAKLNEDTEALLKASRQVIRVGKNSCHELPEDYFALARELTNLGDSSSTPEGVGYIKETFEVLNKLERRPYFDVNADVQSKSLKSRAAVTQGNLAEAEQHISKARKLIEANEDKIKPDASIDFALGLSATGHKDEAAEVLQNVIVMNPENEAIIAKIDAVSDSPVSKEGRSKAADMTKSGIARYEQKDYLAAIGIFKNAVAIFPRHQGLNLNLVQAVVAQVKLNGANSSFERMCRSALDRVKQIDKTDSQYSRYCYLKDQVDEIFKVDLDDFDVDL